MYAGHVGLALGAKGLRKALPLWALIIASQLPDWADASVCLAGITSPTPGMYSHSFPAIGILTVVGALVYLMTTRDLVGAAFVGALVISHALGDYVTGIKPTWNGGPMIGLQFYHHPALDFVAEAIVILAGWMLYRSSVPKDRQASSEVWTMLGFLLAIQALADVVFHLVRASGNVELPQARIPLLLFPIEQWQLTSTTNRPTNFPTKRARWHECSPASLKNAKP